MTIERRTLTKKEVAHILGVSVRKFCRNEKQWGLRAARLRMNGWILYDRAKAIAAIIRMGVTCK